MDIYDGADIHALNKNSLAATTTGLRLQSERHDPAMPYAGSLASRNRHPTLGDAGPHLSQMAESWVNLQTEPRPIGAVQTCCFFIALMDFCHLPRGRQTSPFQPEKPHSQLSKIVSGWADRELASPPKNIGGLLSAGRPWRIGGQLHGRTGFGGGNPGEVNHSLMFAAASVCRARRKSISRSLPGGSILAWSLKSCACCASRSSKLFL